VALATSGMIPASLVKRAERWVEQLDLAGRGETHVRARDYLRIPKITQGNVAQAVKLAQRNHTNLQAAERHQIEPAMFSRKPVESGTHK
jgi:hypothetical protein